MHMQTHMQMQTHKTHTMPTAMHFTGLEGHHHLFYTIKILVLLLWKLLEIEFHYVSVCVYVCVIVVQVHVGNSEIGVMLSIGMHPSALYCYFISLSFGGRKPGNKFIETIFLHRKRRLMKTIMSCNPLRKLIVHLK